LLFTKEQFVIDRIKNYNKRVSQLVPDVGVVWAMDDRIKRDQTSYLNSVVRGGNDKTNTS